MYLNHNFHSNSTLLYSRFRYFTVDYLYFFLQGSRNTQVFLLSELAGYESGFLVNLLITTIWVKDHFLPSFLASSSIRCPCSIHPPLKFSVSSIIVNLIGGSFSNIWYIFEVQWFTSLLQCVSVADFFKSNLFESPTNYMCFKVISNFFIYQRLI